MISAKFLWGNVLLGGKLQIGAKNSNFEIFESALYMKSVSMPLTPWSLRAASWLVQPQHLYVHWRKYCNITSPSRILNVPCLSILPEGWSCPRLGTGRFGLRNVTRGDPPSPASLLSPGAVNTSDYSTPGGTHLKRWYGYVRWSRPPFSHLSHHSSDSQLQHDSVL